MAVLAFVGQKGGASKTTAALSVACELMARGRAVLIVDGDPQGSARTFGEVAAEQKHAAPTIVAMGADMFAPHQVPRLARDYEHVVIDCPPRHGEIQRAALMCADLAVVPCGPSPVDAWALAATVQLVTEARSMRPALRAVVLIARKSPRTTLGRDAREALAGGGLDLLASEMTYRVAYQEAPAAGLGVTAYAPRDPAADEVRALTDELLALVSPPPTPKRPRRGKAQA
jgi:chromosome partitioning protein